MSTVLSEPPLNSAVAAAPSRRPVLRRRRHGPINAWWIRLHRWASLTLGLALLVEVTSGAILLYKSDIETVLHPERYVVTPSADPMTPLEALRLAQDEHPELAINYLSTQESGVYAASGDTGPSVFIDPGTGAITAVGEQTPWILKLLVNVHDCALTCENYPWYQAWLATPLPAVNDHITIGGFVLGSLGVLLLFLAISGTVIWWPGLRAWVTGFVVRRRRGAYVRDIDLHRMVGIIAMPFLAMWAFTGAAFEFHWPEQAYFAFLPGQATPDPEVEHGTGPQIGWDQAVDRALALHPGATVTRLYESTPAEPEGAYGVSLRDGWDPYGYSSFGGGTYVDVDSHGGGVADYVPRSGDDAPIAQQLWDNNTYYGLHFGTLVPWVPRGVLLVFGLTPVLLAVTGITVWLTKRRSIRNRRRRRRRAAA